MMPEKLRLPTLTTLHIQKMMLVRQKLQLLISSQRQRMREESLTLQLLTKGVMQNRLPGMRKTRLSMRGLKRKSEAGKIAQRISNGERMEQADCTDGSLVHLALSAKLLTSTPNAPLTQSTIAWGLTGIVLMGAPVTERSSRVR